MNNIFRNAKTVGEVDKIFRRHAAAHHPNKGGTTANFQKLQSARNAAREALNAKYRLNTPDSLPPVIIAKWLQTYPSASAIDKKAILAKVRAFGDTSDGAAFRRVVSPFISAHDDTYKVYRSVKQLPTIWWLYIKMFLVIIAAAFFMFVMLGLAHIGATPPVVATVASLAAATLPAQSYSRIAWMRRMKAARTLNNRKQLAHKVPPEYHGTLMQISRVLAGKRIMKPKGQTSEQAMRTTAAFVEKVAASMNMSVQDAVEFGNAIIRGPPPKTPRMGLVVTSALAGVMVSGLARAAPPHALTRSGLVPFATPTTRAVPAFHASPAKPSSAFTAKLEAHAKKSKAEHNAWLAKMKLEAHAKKSKAEHNAWLAKMNTPVPSLRNTHTALNLRPQTGPAWQYDHTLPVSLENLRSIATQRRLGRPLQYYTSHDGRPITVKRIPELYGNEEHMAATQEAVTFQKAGRNLARLRFGTNDPYNDMKNTDWKVRHNNTYFKRNLGYLDGEDEYNLSRRAGRYAMEVNKLSPAVNKDMVALRVTRNILLEGLSIAEGINMCKSVSVLPLKTKRKHTHFYQSAGSTLLSYLVDMDYADRNGMIYHTTHGNSFSSSMGFLQPQCGATRGKSLPYTEVRNLLSDQKFLKMSEANVDLDSKAVLGIFVNMKEILDKKMKWENVFFLMSSIARQSEKISQAFKTDDFLGTFYAIDPLTENHDITPIRNRSDFLKRLTLYNEQDQLHISTSKTVWHNNNNLNNNKQWTGSLAEAHLNAQIESLALQIESLKKAGKPFPKKYVPPPLNENNNYYNEP